MAELEGDAGAPPPSPSASDGVALEAPRRVVEHPFEFRGNASEYFRIWIVNLALTLVTIGVFSAWAKVRRERYFYGNTWVAGAPFEYLANPINILKGRIVAVVAFGLYALLGHVEPFAQLVLIAVVLVVSPLIIANALRFRARYSAWNTLTFRFLGSLKNAFKVYLGLIVLMVPTFGLIFPYARFRQRGYVVSGHRFGGVTFEFSSSAREFYRIYVKAGFVSFGCGVLAAVALMATFAALAQTTKLPFRSLNFFISAAVTYGTAFFVWSYVAARVTNLSYNSSKLGEHRFRSTVRARDLIAIYLTNAVAIVLSVGMLVPWAQVRLARYRAAHFVLCAQGDLAAFVAEASADRSAFGEETANIFDMDLSL